MSEGKRAESPSGLRAQKKLRTLFELCSAARRLAVERGLDATTVDDIARAVGVSPRTFFNYYDTKMDAIVGPVTEIGTPEARQRFIDGGPSGVLIDDLTWLYSTGFEPESAIRESVSLVIELIKGDSRVLAAFIAAGVRQEAAVGELLTARLGEVSPEFVGLVAAIMSTLTTQAARTMAEDPARSLSTALEERRAMAARLFHRPHDTAEE